jgi:hypothetical protein
MNNPPNPPHPRQNTSWFPSAEEMSKAAKYGGVFSKPTAPSPEQHLQDANKGKITNFDKPKRP